MGTIYRPSSPKAFLDALDALPELCPALETRFVGRTLEEFDRSIFDRRKSLLRFTGSFVPQKEAIRLRMEEADILLLPAVPPLQYSGKLFEYLATGKPILALCPPGSDVERIVRETSSGWYVDTEDPVAIQRVLTEIHALQGKFPQNRNWEAIRRYERPNLVAEYAQLIRDCDRTS